MGLLFSACPSSHERGIENFITLLHLHITLPSKPDLHLAIYCRSLLFRGFKSQLWVRVKARRNVVTETTERGALHYLRRRNWAVLQGRMVREEDASARLER